MRERKRDVLVQVRLKRRQGSDLHNVQSRKEVEPSVQSTNSSPGDRSALCPSISPYLRYASVQEKRRIRNLEARRLKCLGV